MQRALGEYVIKSSLRVRYKTLESPSQFNKIPGFKAQGLE
jgi:hypothetical protein